MIEKQPLLNQMIKYGAVGAVSTAIDMVILNIIKLFFGWPLWLALALGFLAGTVNGYYLNSRWTFHFDAEGEEGKKFLQFAIVSAIGLGLTELIVNSYVNFIDLGLSFFDRDLSSYNVGKLIAVALVFFWNFSANKFWTFRQRAGVLGSDKAHP